MDNVYNIYIMNIQVSKCRFNKISFTSVLKVTEGSFLLNRHLNCSITRQLYIENFVVLLKLNIREYVVPRYFL